MTRLSRGAAWLMDKLQASAGVAITYARNDVQSDPIIAVVSQTSYEVVDERSGLMTSVQSWDWTIKAADLTVTPWKGDRIITTSLGTFEVLPLGKLPCFEWLDSSGLLLLVHTKRIS
jgi:hypothetical protein